MIPFLKRVHHHSPSNYSSIIAILYRKSIFFGFFITFFVGLSVNWWFPFLAPGWSQDQISNGILAVLIGSGLIFAQTVLYAQAAFYNVEKRFIFPMWRPIFLNIGAIIALMLVSNKVEYVLLGMLISQLLIMTLMHLKYRNILLRSNKNQIDPIFLHEVFNGFAYIGLATASQQVCVVAERWFASLLQEGSITLLSLAYRITTIPLTIFSLSILSILYPTFSDVKLYSNPIAFKNLIKKSVKLTLIFMVPASVLLASQADLVIRVLLERGAFGVLQTKETAPMVAAYALGLPGFGLALLWGRILVARQNARIFLYAAVISMVFTITLDGFWYRTLGASGLAGAFSVGGWVQALLTGWFVERDIPGSLDVYSILRWVFSGGFVLWALSSVSFFIGIPGLIVACLTALLGTIGLLALVGERDLFQIEFWNLRSIIDYRSET